MVDFNGGGGVVGIPGFSSPIGPAMSADQINSSMGMGPGGAGAINQAALNNNFNNFGQQTDYYSGLGAAYGRATGGFGGYGGQNDPFSPASGGGYNDGAGMSGQGATGGLARNPDGSINQQDPGNIAAYWAAMGGGTPTASNTGSSGTNSMAGALWGGTNSNTGAPAIGGGGSFPSVDPTPNVGAGAGGGGAWSPALTAGGQIDQSNAGNIAKYWELMGGGANSANTGSSGRDQLANTLWQGTNSNTGAPALTGSGGTSSIPYQGNPFYLPQPMQGQPAVPEGGGFGAPGFGIGQGNYTGQPGFGLGIGTVNGNGAPNVGTIPGVDNGQSLFGYGGLTDASNFPGGWAAYSRGGG